MSFKKGQPEKHIRDDYLGSVFSKMQTLLGGSGQLMVSLDACHSGTGTRGVMPEEVLPVARGTSIIYGEPPATPTTVSFSDKAATNFGIASNADGKATMVCFFGASPQELNYEYWSKDIKAGSLSYALYKALSRLDKGTSFRDLFLRIKSTMGAIAPQQSPQVEGPLDKLVFSNGLTKPVMSFIATGELNGNQVSINAGTIDGVSDTSKFIVMEQQPDRSLVERATAVVVNRGLASSMVQLDKNLPPDAVMFMKFYLPKKQVRYETSINIAQAPNWKNVVQLTSTEDYTFNTTATQAPLQLKEIQDKNGKVLELYNQQMKLERWNLQANQNEQVVMEVQKKLRKVAWTGFLKQLNSQMADSKISAELWVLPFDTVNKKPRLDQPVQKITDFNTLPTLGADKCYKIHIKNETGNKLYYSIIDFQPDEVSNFLVPYGQEQPSSFVLPPYESIEFPGFDYYLELGPPSGKELLKIIASNQPIDFSGLSTRGNSTGNSVNYVNEEDNEAFQFTQSGTRGAASRLSSFVLSLTYNIKL
jgi:hypothetical protein